MDLADVLKDAEQLHALPGPSRRELVERRQRRDVRGLVDAQKQRRVDRLARARGLRERLGDDRGKQAAQALLIIGRRCQIQRVVARQQPARADRSRARGRGRDRWLKPGVKRRRRRHQHRRARARPIPRPAAATAAPSQRRRRPHCASAPAARAAPLVGRSDPPEDHRQVAARGSEKQRREITRRGRPPKLAVPRPRRARRRGSGSDPIRLSGTGQTP